MSSAEEPGQRRRRAVSRIGVAVSCAGGSQSFRLVGVRGVSALAPPIQHTAHKRRIRGEGFTLSFHYYRTSTAIRRAPQRRETRPVRASPAQGDNRHRAKILLVASSGPGTEAVAQAGRPWRPTKGMETVKRGESLETARERANICTPRNLRCTAQPTDEPGLRPEPRTRPHERTSPAHVTLAAFRMRLTPRRAPREAPAPAHGARAPRGSRPPDEGGNQWRHHRSS